MARAKDGKARGNGYGPTPELMGAWEVAEELLTTSSNLSRIVGLPEPVAELKATRVWRADQIRDFAVERRQRRARRL